MFKSLLKAVLVLTGLISHQNTFAQSVYTPLNSDYNYLIDRNEIKSGQQAYSHTSFKPYQRKNIASFLEHTLSDSTIHPSKQDNFNKTYLLHDNWENLSTEVDSKKPFLKVLYKKPNAFINYQNSDFEIQVNPILQTQIGAETNAAGYRYTNTKGVEMRGMINKKVGFYSFLTDNQINYNTYVNHFIVNTGAIPGEGFHKEFKKTATDFITARGYITFNATKNIHLQFGHDKNFIGNGVRSLILSDFSNSYLFLKAQTTVWKFKYTNLFAQMNAMGPHDFGPNNLYPRKYFALHHLSLNVTKNFNIGLFESIVFGRSDPNNQGNFDLNYINPVIFYRWAEQQNGSPDNANIGLDFKLNTLRHFSLYGQLFIDEFIFANIKAGNGSWTNKQGVQLGVKAIDVFNVSTLDFQLETNIVRPYTYSHFNNYTNYTNYAQPLAHPYGANFNEFIGIMRFQPINRLQLIGKLIYAKIGVDPNSSNDSTGNFGGNIFKPYDKVAKDHLFGNTIGQGISSKLIYLSGTATYMLKHNLFMDVEMIARTYSNILVHEKALIFNVGVRLNIARRVQEF